MEFGGGRSHRMVTWTHIRERENERRTEDGGVVSIVLHGFGRPFARPPVPGFYVMYGEVVCCFYLTE